MTSNSPTAQPATPFDPSHPLTKALRDLFKEGNVVVHDFAKKPSHDRR